MKTAKLKVPKVRKNKDLLGFDLDDDEQVVLVMQRSMLGVIGIIFMTTLCLVGLIVALVLIFNTGPISSFLNGIKPEARGYLNLIIVLLFVIILGAGFISYYVYTGNKMFITNKRAIQLVRTSVFSGSTNTVELRRVEDVSFHQNGFLQSIFNVGTLRMSTESDETTYTFPFLDTPQDEVETIAKLIRSRSSKAAPAAESEE